jgi:hypothetical protein
MESNKTGKYLKYAFGEILLVVIGILIAVQINTWNQDRIDRKSEKKILIDLRQELLTNKQKIRESIENRKARNQPLERYMKSMEEDRISYSDFLEIHKTNFWSGQIHPSFGVINSLISSGEVNLISNDSLKYLATDWKDVMSVFMSVEQNSFDGNRRFSDYFDNRFPLRGNQFHNKSSKELQNRFEKTIEDVEYGNKLILIHSHFLAAIQIGQETIEYIDEMTNFIDREIEMLE